MTEEIEDDKPLDPAIEAVRKRLARLMVVSIGIMMVGLLAVLGAIVYKTTGRTEVSTGSGTLAIPDGMTVVDHSLDGDRISLRLRGIDGRETIMLFSVNNGTVTGEWPIVSNMKN
ncbi:MAG: hypothetical protein ACRCT6_03840 [Notoacmeibacter sp.]